MALKTAQKAAQKKAAKQKKILVVLGVVLLGTFVYGYMTLSHSGGGSSTPVPASPAAATTPASSIPSASAGAPVTAGVTAPPVGPLGSFVALGRKDPFNDGGPKSSSPSGSTKKKPGGGGGGSSKPKQPPAPLTGAVVSLNGKQLALALGANFGRAPGLSGVFLFQLSKVSAKEAVISVVGTKQQFTLYRGRPLTLEQDGGWTYTLVLEPLGSPAPMSVLATTTTTGN